MNKTAIKSFAIEARKKLISEITYRAGLAGITESGINEPVHKAEGIDMHGIGSSDPYVTEGEQLLQRKSLALRMKEKGFDKVIEEVAYTWFSRIIAVRYMEINDYLPTHVRVLSSETTGKIEPDIVSAAPDVNLGLTSVEIDEIMKLKQDNKLDELFRMLFVKQCKMLNGILPELFEEIPDYTELLLPVSFTDEDGIVRFLIESVGEDDYKEQVEIIGWMYQYYNTELKDDTFAKLKENVKITKERIPVATQLFTPDWIVRYLVENSIGRLWLEHLQACDQSVFSVKTNWKYYLNDAEQEPEVIEQLQKTIEERKNLRLEDIKIIDPCMGSGHILVYAFNVLMDIYKSCGYKECEAVKLILRNNLYGLDIDERVYRFAYFAIMMKARGYSRNILNEGIMPNLHVIRESNGIDFELNISNAQLKELSDFFVQGVSENEKIGLKADFEYLLEVFRDAEEYGTIINVKEINYEAIERRIEEIKAEEAFDCFAMQYKSMIIEKLPPLVKQARILAQKYDVVVTNPPYMGTKGMNVKVADYVSNKYPDSKADLFAVFIEACAAMTRQNGFQAMITQHSWMFLSSYERLRHKVLTKDIVNMIHLGARAFEEIGGEVVQTAAFVLNNTYTKYRKTVFAKLIDIDNAQLKEMKFLSGENRYSARKEDFSEIPGMPIAYWISENVLKAFNNPSIYSISTSGSQNKTGNNSKYVRSFWEVEKGKIGVGEKWIFYAKGGGYRKWYGNLEELVDWSDEARHSYKTGYASQVISREYWYQKGITWGIIARISFRYLNEGSTYDMQGSAIFINDDSQFNYVIGFLNSIVAETLLLALNTTLSFQVRDIRNLPVIFSRKEEVDLLVKMNIEISKADWDSFETSFDFGSHPLLKCRAKNVKSENEIGKCNIGNERSIDKKCINENGTCRIQDAFEAWKSLTDKRFTQLKTNEEELNRIFIESYGLQDELTPEVDEKDITVCKADIERDIKSFISYAVGCMFGRYSLDAEGLAYAGGEWDNDKYKTIIPVADNVILITDTEYFNNDMVGRFVEFVKVTFGKDTLEENLDFIAKALGKKGNISSWEVIRQYFLKNFYKDHVKRYQKKPIYWMFDSGIESGFKALIYMHRYNQDIVESVWSDYLYKVQKEFESTLSKAKMITKNTTNKSEKGKTVKEMEKLVRQLAEIKIYDAAIGHIAAQKIPINLDDGVKINYARFQEVKVSIDGEKASKIDLLSKI